jgi:predicted RNase H-like HicB family nuclease
MAHIHEEVLEAANRIASRRQDYTFQMDEVIRALPHLNENSVRTHIGSRCCINAPRHHVHKWDYFRRIARGRYEILPGYRSPASPAEKSPRKVSTKPRGKVSGARRDTVHVVVNEDDGTYTAECLELPVVTQGNTLDEVIENLKQAVALHLEDEDMATFGLIDNPRLHVVYTAPLAS